MTQQIHRKLTELINAAQYSQPPGFKTGAALQKHNAGSQQSHKCCVNTDTISKFKNKDKSVVIDNEPNNIYYFLPGPSQDNDKGVSAKITQQLQ